MVPELQLVIGNRNYSSWSLRAWLAAKASGLAFEEILIPLDRPETKGLLAQHSPSGLVPVLKVGSHTVWDSLAIIETLNDLAPGAGIWPQDAMTRAWARAVSAEMHAGFFRLRRDMPMDLRTSLPGAQHTEGALGDAAKIIDIWSACREAHSANGPFLFGDWSAADMMYAPVVGRFRTYGVELPAPVQAYSDAVWAQPDMAAWLAGARAEPYVIEYDLGPGAGA